MDPDTRTIQLQEGSPDYAMPMLKGHRFVDGRQAIFVFAIGYLITVIVLASIHCAAWVWEFPTSVEQTLWRISCLCTLCLLIGLEYIVFTSLTVLWDYRTVQVI